MSFAQPATVDDLLNYRLSCLLESSGAMITRLCEGRYGITRREWRLIALLAAHGQMSPSALATRAQLERPRISRLLAELVGKGLVLKVQLPHDKRRAEVELTARGQALYDELFPQSAAIHQQVLAALRPAELKTFDKVLTRLTEHARAVGQAYPSLAKANRRGGGSRRVRRP